MTTWIENPEGGRDRGPRALARAWIEVLVRPGRFFRTGVGPGDQAPGLTFAIVVAVAFTAGWIAFDPTILPSVIENRALAAVLVLLLVGVLVAPVTLHLVAALTVAGLALVVTDRAGISETVQVVAYATAPMAVAGAPIPILRVVCGIYGTGLLIYGLKCVHGTTWGRALIAGAVPAVVTFGVGFRTIAAFRHLLG